MEELLAQLQNPKKDTPTKARSLTHTILLLPLRTRRFFLIATFAFIVSSFVLLARINDRFLVEVPRHGGELTEGIIGRPRFINPVIAKSDADRDMTALVYSGLLRATESGGLTPDLASRYDVSPDGLTYTFTLREGLLWHDGEPITSADIAFTIDKVRDQGLAIRSPRRASWEGVTVETPDPLTIIFRIKQPYAPFLESATMGILPKHIWQNVPNDEFDVTYYNIKPIGSGPYRVGAVVQDNDNGLPKYYDLIAFKRHATGEPYITNLRIMFFGNNKELTQAYGDKTIDQMHSVEPALAESITSAGGAILRAPLPRVFALFFNQNHQPVFADASVRKALSLAIDKDKIVKEVLYGYGRTIDGPLPLLPSLSSTSTATTSINRIQESRRILEAGGWAPNAVGIYEKADKKKKTVSTLEFSVAIPDVPELKQAGEMLKSDWEKIGARVNLQIFESSTFATDILSPRKYDILFYGQVLGRTPDPFAYWHSSQRNAPGLNVALYTNKTVDKLLESARKERDEVARTVLLNQFVTELNKDIPAIFIYSPDFLYATSPRTHGIRSGLITTESERFLSIPDWYIESERVWTWFRDNMEERNY